MTESGSSRPRGRPKSVVPKPAEFSRHPFMRAADFQAGAKTIFPGSDWDERTAAALGVASTTVWRYVNEQVPIPGPVAAAMHAWLTLHAIAGSVPAPIGSVDPRGD